MILQRKTLEGMGIGEMSEVMKQGSGEKRPDPFRGAPGERSGLQQADEHLTGEVKYTEAVAQPGMDSAGIQEMGRTQLPYPCQFRHLGAVKQGFHALGYIDMLPKRIPYRDGVGGNQFFCHGSLNLVHHRVSYREEVQLSSI